MSTPAQQLHDFLNGLPPPFREQLLYRLYAFFDDQIVTCFALELDHDDTLAAIILPSGDYWNFQRAILIIGALDYLFSQKAPWPTLVEAYASIELAGLTCSAFRPVNDEAYLAAREKWNKLRSKLSYFLLRKLDEKISLSYQKEQDQLAPDL